MLLLEKGRQLLTLQCSCHDLTSKPEAPSAGLLLAQASAPSKGRERKRMTHSLAQWSSWLTRTSSREEAPRPGGNKSPRDPTARLGFSAMFAHQPQPERPEKWGSDLWGTCPKMYSDEEVTLPLVSRRPKVGKCTCSAQLPLCLGQQLALASMAVEATLSWTYKGALGLPVISPVLPLCAQIPLNSDEETKIHLPSRTSS